MNDEFVMNDKFVWKSGDITITPPNVPLSLTVEERIDLVRFALSQVDRHEEPKRWHQLVGQLGGLTTLLRHGVDHFISTGKIGFAETVRKHWRGNRDGFIQYLHARASIVLSDREAGLMISVYLEWRPDLLEKEV